MVMSMGMVLMASSPAQAAIQKVWVCKYSHTPEIGEVAQTVISVDYNDNRQVGTWGFEDQQGFSFVYGVSVGDGAVPKPDNADDCPPYNPPGDTPIDPPAAPTPVDPCGPGNIAFPAQTDTAQLDWTLLENGDLTVAPKVGYVFTGTSQLITFTLPADSNEPCIETITPPGAPDTLDPCNEPGVTSNISFVIPADTATLNWEAGPDGSATVAPQSGYQFSGGSQLISFPLPADSGEECVLGVEQVRPGVSFQDPTCSKPNRATWSGELTDIVDYTVTGTPGLGADVTVDAAIKPDMADQYEFVDGAVTSFSHGYPTLEELDCVKGSETIVPKPDKEPTVLGTQAAVPTAVAAGLGGTSTDAGTTTQLIAQMLVAGGMLLLMAGGWIGLGRRESGAHEA